MRTIVCLWLALLLGAPPRQEVASPVQHGVLRTTGAFFALSVADLDASATWYREKLGLEVVLRTPSGADPSVVVLEGGGLIVELVHHVDAVALDRAGAHAAAKGRDSMHGYFKAGAIIEDFDKTVAVLRQRGVEIFLGPFPRTREQRANVLIKDDAGNLIQLFGA